MTVEKTNKQKKEAFPSKRLVCALKFTFKRVLDLELQAGDHLISVVCLNAA